MFRAQTGPLFAVIMVSLSAGLAGCAPTEATAVQKEEAAASAANDGLLLSDPDDAKIVAAKAEAIRTLPIFWAKWAAKPPGYSDFALKVAFRVKDHGSEHIWARPLRRTGGELVVRLANDPAYFVGLKMGSEVAVDESDVSDWAYARDGKLYGHFTTRALLDRAGPAERTELERVLAPTPLEPSER
jgi:uncharacterized protein YegJ (DUF2314 family)